MTLRARAIGAIFGTAEVTVVAYAEASGQKGAASFILAGYAAGSFIVGLVFGAMKLEMPLSRRLVIAIVVAALTTMPLLFVGNIPGAGRRDLPRPARRSRRPSSRRSSLIERLVPSSKMTEGMTWAMTGIGIGMAIGSSVSGYIIDAYGATAASGCLLLPVQWRSRRRSPATASSVCRERRPLQCQWQPDRTSAALRLHPIEPRHHQKAWHNSFPALAGLPNGLPVGKAF